MARNKADTPTATVALGMPLFSAAISSNLVALTPFRTRDESRVKIGPYQTVAQRARSLEFKSSNLRIWAVLDRLLDTVYNGLNLLQKRKFRGVVRYMGE